MLGHVCEEHAHPAFRFVSGFFLQLIEQEAQQLLSSSGTSRLISSSFFMFHPGSKHVLPSRLSRVFRIVHRADHGERRLCAR